MARDRRSLSSAAPRGSPICSVHAELPARPQLPSSAQCDNARWDNPVKIRSCKYLNNIVEQDHRRVKFRLATMLGFKSFHNARIVIAGIELIHKLKKGQYGVPFCFGLSARDIWSNVLAA